MGAMRLGSRGQELDCRGVQLSPAAGSGPSCEVGASLGELVNMPALLYLTSPLGPSLAASMTKKKNKDRSKGCGRRTGSRKRYMNPQKNSRRRLKAQHLKWGMCLLWKDLTEKRVRFGARVAPKGGRDNTGQWNQTSHIPILSCFQESDPCPLTFRVFWGSQPGGWHFPATALYFATPND